ncbi:MAG TPA: aspartate--tRNA(Asn) ligase [Nitrososphaeraceae archaeon]|nr:aspartate--tRNA(Asn) ligase [Nitrososphaeraceae archaeon]
MNNNNSIILREEELGNWRKSHYSSEINPSLEGRSVILMGWISSIRDHGNIQFIMLRDKDGDTQIIAKKGQCPDLVYEQVLQLKEHTSLGVNGKVISQRKAPNGIEIIPLELKVFSIPIQAPPFMVQNRNPAGIDTRLDFRAIDLRRKYLQDIFIIRNNILKYIRNFLSNEKFIEVNTPKIIATASEGGTALFPIFYYEREAFLAQSPQIYKEQLTMAFEKVFEIGPIFRAEPSRTNRHLSEATSIDIESAFVDYNDIIVLLEKMIQFIIKSLSEDDNSKNSPELDIDQKINDNNKPFPRLKYSELIERFRNIGEKVRWGDDISPQLIKKLDDDRLNNNFYFITDWPTAAKPFYVKENQDDSKICESFDLMYGSLEISSGSTRISNKEILIDRMKKKGLNLNSFDYHLRIFSYGVPPHAGCGIGLERLLMTLTKIDNIRDAILYPRDIDRLAP